MSAVNEETKSAPSGEAPSEAPARSDATAAEAELGPNKSDAKDDGAVVDDKAGDKSGGDNAPASGVTAAPPPAPAAAAPAPGLAAAATAVPPPVAPGYGMPAYYAGAWPYGACGAAVPANPPAVTPPGSYGAGGALLGPFPNQMGGYAMPGGMMFPGAMAAQQHQQLQYQQPQPHPYAAATNAAAAAMGGMVPIVPINSDDGTAHPAQEQAKKKRRKKPKDKPRRPLSAYNLFFKDERAKILAQIPGKDRSSLDILDAEGDAKRARTHNPKGKGKKVPHGKIGFESLAKEIGGRWKELPPDRLEHYKKLADEDTERYTREMEEYARRVQSAKDSVAALPPPAPPASQALPSGLCNSYGAPGVAVAALARTEAQRIVNHVVAETSGSEAATGTAAGTANPAPAQTSVPGNKNKRGRRPRDSLLDPEALEAWRSQCKHAMTSQIAAASANAAYYQAQAATAAAMAGAAMAGGYPPGMMMAPYMGGGWPMAGGFAPQSMMSPMAAAQQGTGFSGGGSSSKKDSGNGADGK